MRIRRRLVAPALALLLAGGLAGCRGESTDEPVVAVTLPPASLADQVLQPDDVPDGLVPLLAQTGKADINRIAGFSSDSAAAEKSLIAHGFLDAYVVQYGDPKSGRYIVNVVTTFETEEGATADLTADLEAARGSGTPFPVSDLGDQAGGLRAGPVATTPAAPGTPSASATATGTAPAATPAQSSDLVTVRWRRGATTWLLAVGAPGTVEQDAVVQLARIVLDRAGKDERG